MTIRPANLSDLAEIEEIFIYARRFMAENGNPNQWKMNRPSIETVKEDIRHNRFYIVENNNTIAGCFAFILGDDPTYEIIEEGQWLNSDSYGTIHRIASNGKSKGLFENAIQFCSQKVDNIRIDTHADNKVMQHLLKKNHFQYCGIIYTDDGTKRLAYQKITK